MGLAWPACCNFIMTEFLLAIALFVVAHAVPPAPPVRRRLVSVLGRRLYLTVYSLASLVLLAWVISAAVRAPLILLWAPAGWQWIVPVAAMPLAFWFLVAGFAEANPLSISFRRRDPDVPLPPIVRITRHPVIWGFLIWAGAHVPPNGDAVSLILFGGMTALAAAGIPMLDRRARQRLGDRQWREMSRTTSVFPFAAVLSGRSGLRVNGPFLHHAIAGIAAYLWFLLKGHEWLIGVDPLAWLSW